MRDIKTLIHERVEAARSGENKTLVCRLKGYSLLLRDPVVSDLNALSREERLQFLQDMSLVGDALLEILPASLINYSILGNKDRALHAHIHPRYAEEPDELRTTVPFIYHLKKMTFVPFNLERDKDLIEKLRASILKHSGK